MDEPITPETDEDDLALVLMGAVIARRVQQILGYQDEGVALAVTLATKEIFHVIDGSEHPWDALAEFEQLEEMMK